MPRWLNRNKQETVVPDEAPRPIPENRLRQGLYEHDVNRLLAAELKTYQAVVEVGQNMERVGTTIARLCDAVESHSTVLRELTQHVRELYAALAAMQRDEAVHAETLSRQVSDALRHDIRNVMVQQDSFFLRIERLISQLNSDRDQRQPTAPVATFPGQPGQPCVTAPAGAGPVPTDSVSVATSVRRAIDLLGIQDTGGAQRVLEAIQQRPDFAALPQVVRDLVKRGSKQLAKDPDRSVETLTNLLERLTNPRRPQERSPAGGKGSEAPRFGPNPTEGQPVPEGTFPTSSLSKETVLDDSLPEAFLDDTPGETII